jgi:Na+/melibiose symporter-like transporter
MAASTPAAWPMSPEEEVCCNKCFLPICGDFLVLAGIGILVAPSVVNYLLWSAEATTPASPQFLIITSCSVLFLTFFFALTSARFGLLNQYISALIVFMALATSMSALLPPTHSESNILLEPQCVQLSLGP